MPPAAHCVYLFTETGGSVERQKVNRTTNVAQYMLYLSQDRKPMRIHQSLTSFMQMPRAEILRRLPGASG
jgi:hypothetical protein